MDARNASGGGYRQDLMAALDATHTSIGNRCLTPAGLAIKSATQSITAITSSSTTATAAKVGHGYATGKSVIIAGATQVEYNGTYTVTRIDADSFSYTFAGSVTSPATGTITGTATTGSGNIANTTVFLSSGLQKSKATAAVDFTATTHDIAANADAAQEAKYLVTLGSTGTVTVTMGAVAGAGLSKLPEIPSGGTPIGYILVSVAAGSTKFDATTDALDATHLTVTYVNLGYVAPRFDSIQ